MEHEHHGPRLPWRLHRAHVKSFEDAIAQLGVVSSYPLGLRVVEVARITGSVGRAAALGPDFLPLNARQRNSQRLKRIRAALEQGIPLPPLDLYKVKTDYYVLDGHHRVAAARQLGQLYLEAVVTEFLPVRDVDENRTFLARQRFEDATGLRSVAATTPEHYRRLQRMIREYQQTIQAAANEPGNESKPQPAIPLIVEPDRQPSPAGHQVTEMTETARQALQHSGEPIAAPPHGTDTPTGVPPARQTAKRLSLKEAAALWYQDVYSPVSDLIRQSGVRRSFPGRRAGDLFIYVSDYRDATAAAQKDVRGHPPSWEEAVADFQRIYPAPTARLHRLVPSLRGLLHPLPRRRSSSERN